MISVVIPTFKNNQQLLSNLKHNLEFLKNYEIIIVNDNPNKSIRSDLRTFKNLVLIENKNNLGFGETINVAIRKAVYDFAMLLNDDVVLNDDGFKKALDYFKKDPKLFSVSFGQKEKDGTIVGKNILYWKNGLFYHKKANNINRGYTAWAEGGACMIDKTKFLTIGGFNHLYSPFYWEDIDLSFRAWKNGYKIYFEPAILVKHHHESTIAKYFSKRFIKTVAYRNQFIFAWINISDFDLCVKHILLLPFNLMYYGLIKGQIEVLEGFFKALARIRNILMSRTKIHTKVSDREVLRYLI